MDISQLTAVAQPPGLHRLVLQIESEAHVWGSGGYVLQPSQFNEAFI